MKITTGPVSNEDALKFAAELEAALGEIAEGVRKPGKIPMDPMCRLIHFARDAAARSTPAEIDYPAAIAHCYATLGHAQGTKGCIAFARGAEWAREQLIAATPAA